MGLLEFENRSNEDRYYHLEHYIEGHYTKYNSNSGFVEENIRFTPQVGRIFINDYWSVALTWIPIIFTQIFTIFNYLCLSIVSTSTLLLYAELVRLESFLKDLSGFI